MRLNLTPPVAFLGGLVTCASVETIVHNPGAFMPTVGTVCAVGSFSVVAWQARRTNELRIEDQKTQARLVRFKSLNADSDYAGQAKFQVTNDSTLPVFDVHVSAQWGDKVETGDSRKIGVNKSRKIVIDFPEFKSREKYLRREEDETLEELTRKRDECERSRGVQERFEKARGKGLNGPSSVDLARMLPKLRDDVEKFQHQMQEDRSARASEFAEKVRGEIEFTDGRGHRWSRRGDEQPSLVEVH